MSKKRWAWTLVALAVTALLAWTYANERDEHTRELPVIDAAGLADYTEQYRAHRSKPELVELHGFRFDCQNVAFDGSKILALAYNENPPAAVLVQVDHTSDCEQLSSPLRGTVSSLSIAELEMTGLMASAAPSVRIRPLESPDLLLGILIFMIALSGLLVFTNVRRPSIKVSSAAPDKAQDDTLNDPYRPSPDGRLIREAIEASQGFLRELEGKRRNLAITGGVLVIAALALAIWGGGVLVERELIWNNGQSAPQANVSGKVTRTNLIGVHAELDVAFVDNEGRVHREALSGWSLIQGVDDSRDPEVRFMADEPRRFTVSWLYEQFWGALSLLVIGLAIIGGLGAALWHQSRRDKKPEQTRAVFADPREVRLELFAIEAQVVNGNETGALTYQFKIPNSDRTWSHLLGPKQPRPLLLDEYGRLALGLYNPKDADFVLVLSEDLHELDTPPFSAQVLRARYQGEIEKARRET